MNQSQLSGQQETELQGQEGPWTLLTSPSTPGSAFWLGCPLSLNLAQEQVGFLGQAGPMCPGHTPVAAPWAQSYSIVGWRARPGDGETCRGAVSGSA